MAPTNLFIPQQTIPHSERLRVFVSSVFWEKGRIYKPGETSAIRHLLCAALCEAGHDPWLFEYHAEQYRYYQDRRLSDRETILLALRNCDVVVVLYKCRPGSLMPKEPHHWTDFEWANAVRMMKKPVFFYIIGNTDDPILPGIVRLVTLLPLRALPRWVPLEEEETVPKKVIEDLAELAKGRVRRRIETESIWLPGDISDFSFDHLVSRMEQISELGSTDQYGEAEAMVETIPILECPGLDRRSKVVYALLLGLCGNVYANRMRFDLAIKATACSIKLFMELGLRDLMFAHIQALSGIMNLANQSGAFAVNTYGLEVAANRLYPHQLPAYYDSSASMLLRSGDFKEAKRRLKFTALKSPSPYAVAKYARSVAFQDGTSGVGQARRIVSEEALPESLRTGRSSGYVLMEDARLAVLDRDWWSVYRSIEMAERYCRDRGLTLTLRQLAKVKAVADYMVQGGTSVAARLLAHA